MPCPICGCRLYADGCPLFRLVERCRAEAEAARWMQDELEAQRMELKQLAAAFGLEQKNSR